MSDLTEKYTGKNTDIESLSDEEKVEIKHIEKALRLASNIYQNYLQDFGIDASGIAFLRLEGPQGGFFVETNICGHCLAESLGDVSEELTEMYKNKEHSHE